MLDCQCDITITKGPGGTGGAYLGTCSLCGQIYPTNSPDPADLWPPCPSKCQPEPTPVINMPTESLIPSDLPCIHRGEPIDQQVCKPCSGQPFNVVVYACDERARCTIRAYKAGQKEIVCLRCDKRLAPVVYLPSGLE